MTLLLDTNVLVAAVTHDTDRSEIAVEVLNAAEDPHVTVLSLMELRSVLSKKKTVRTGPNRTDRKPDHRPDNDHVPRRLGHDGGR